jgi:hypothetical protein
MKKWFNFERFRRRMGVGLRVSMLAWLALHFAMTILYVMPSNPLKESVRPLLNMTIGLFFQQNWSLFAPNPATSTTTLLVKPMTEDESKHIQFIQARSNWYDVSMPFYHEFQRNRFTAYDRLERPIANTAMLYLSGGQELAPWVTECKQGDKEACDHVTKALKAAQPAAAAELVKIASSYCNSSKLNAKYVALAIRQQDAVPWSKRYTGKPRIRDFFIGVYPVDRTRVSTGLLKIGGPVQ